MSLRAPEGLHGRVSAWLVLAVSVAMTLLAWRASLHYQRLDAEQRFAAAADAAVLRISERMHGYEIVLRAGAGLFDASQEVSAEEWQRFTTRLDLPRSYPGIQGLGYTAALRGPEVEAFDRAQRAAGRTGFHTHPRQDSRPDPSSIVYLEPADWRNARALGFDMGSEPVRREAMERARDRGQAALSGRVRLVQETSEGVQAGSLMYWPVYRRGARLDDPDRRAAALQGHVYAAFRMDDLMAGILGPGIPALVLTLYDGPRDRPEHQLHRSGEWRPDAAFEVRRALTVAGRTWSMHFISTQDFEDEVASLQPTLIALGGLGADLLLFITLGALSRNSRLLALRAAELQASQAQVQHLAFHDPLTQLPNRRLLMDRLSQALPAARRSREHGALFFIDLDHFKQVNDQHGHATGDALLAQCAQRLRACTRAEDTVARLGGDEFVVMVSPLPRDEAAARAQLQGIGLKLREALAPPYHLPGLVHQSTPSIGAVLFRDEDGPDEVLGRADAAMYQAKRGGRGRVAVWDPGAAAPDVA